jgi:hypothetical protein
MPAQTRVEEGRSYRRRQREQMGEQAYKDIESLKRKERRQKNQLPPPTTTPVIVEIKQPQPTKKTEKVSDNTLEAIYVAKLALAEASGHTIKLSSVKTTYNRMKKLHTHMFDAEMSDFAWTKDTAVVSDFILSFDKWKTQESRIQQFQSLASILKVVKGYDSIYKFYSDKSIVMRNDKTKVDDKNELTDREADMLPWNQILKVKPDNAKDAALVGVYTLIQPRRAADFGLMRVATETEELDSEFNYVVLNAKNKPVKFVFLNYKTSSTFGKQEFTIPRNLATLLTKHIESSELHFGNYLFGKSKTAPFASFSSQVSKVFKKYTGKSISVNLLRHSFITHYLKKPNLTIADKKKISYAMSHSLDMQMRYNRVDLSE